MAVPKSRKSKAKGKMRRSHWKLNATSLSECPQCHEKKLPHRVCKSCGYYNGKAVVKVSNE